MPPSLTLRFKLTMKGQPEVSQLFDNKSATPD